ncbi:low temperature requirement protein A [Micromonospora phytophila]|uniref:low temperature requirement protein A n=1 Tax=Micromonospora phytophila TaxID=709888 RepID=UPI00202DB8A1|nr:low temperature requirement protein A [Micromonospora phytophila]MCM0675295.1 low temperature requirement protein A [Micromonospora phytophila]
MTTSRADELLRRPGEPQRTTFLELFFDLAFVVAFTQISRGLAHDLSWRGAFQTLVLLLAMWWVWFITASLTDRYDPQRPVIQLLVIATLVGSLVLAAAAPESFAERGLIFAGVYVAIQLGRGLFLVLAVRNPQLKRRPGRALVWFGVSAVPWIAGAMVHGTARGALWALAVAVDYAGGTLGWPTPGLGRAPRWEWSVAAEHLAERYRQFFIIALGELILVTALTLSRSGFAAYQTAAFLVSIATTVLFWRIYSHRAGEVLATAIKASPGPLRLAFWAKYAHMVMVAGIVVTAVGCELVIDHPLGHTRPGWVAVILGGPALFLAGRSLFEYAVFSRVSPDRLIGLLVLAAAAPVTLLVPPLLVALAATAVLTGIAIADTTRARRHPSEASSPAGGPS